MVAIIKYNAGNTQSVMCALKRLGVPFILTDDESAIRSADHVIFPGVGEARSAMSYLKERGMVSLIRSLDMPFLGICLGMQLLSSFSEENDTECLDIVPLSIRRFEKREGYKIPHMGWNTVSFDESCPLFKGISNDSYFYFVHSYYAEDSDYAIARTDYDGITFSSAIAKDNFYGVQFHPEKSGEDGLRLLSNFLKETR